MVLPAMDPSRAYYWTREEDALSLCYEAELGNGHGGTIREGTMYVGDHLLERVLGTSQDHHGTFLDFTVTALRNTALPADVPAWFEVRLYQRGVAGERTNERVFRSDPVAFDSHGVARANLSLGLRRRPKWRPPAPTGTAAPGGEPG